MTNKTADAIAAGTRTAVCPPSKASRAAATSQSCMITMIPISSETEVNSVTAWRRVSKATLLLQTSIPTAYKSSSRHSSLIRGRLRVGGPAVGRPSVSEKEPR